MQRYTRFFENAKSILPKNHERVVTLVPGDGIGRELCNAAMGVVAAAHAPIVWDTYNIEKSRATVPSEVVSSIARTRVCLKGPLQSEFNPYDFHANVGTSKNWQLRKSLDLYANVLMMKSIPGVVGKHKDIDMVVFRQNTEGEYSGLEQEVRRGVVQSMKLVSREASDLIAECAFAFAEDNKRKKVTAVHKANIQKLSDGLFLESCRRVSALHPDIAYEEMIIDNCCMQLVMRPQQFDVVVMPNLYGSLVSNIVSSLLGGPGVVASLNFSADGTAIFEAARHTGGDIAGQNVANPIGVIKATSMLLRHVDCEEEATLIDRSLRTVLETTDIRTPDLGGRASTSDFTSAVIAEIDKEILKTN